MLMVVSPAKSLDFESPLPSGLPATRPPMLDESARLADILRQMAPQDIAGLMQVSDKIAALNVARFAEWHANYSAPQARQAVFAFNGDVYEGLDAASMDRAGLDWLQPRLNILSGLYGLLRPLDLMLPYRLEMGTRLANPRGKDLYAFWGERITTELNARLQQDGSQVLVNLASDEYFRSVKPAQLAATVWTPVFRDSKAGGPYKIVSFWAKRARGLMVRWMAEQRIESPDDLRAFDVEGYRFNPAASNGTTLVFLRDH